MNFKIEKMYEFSFHESYIHLQILPTFNIFWSRYFTGSADEKWSVLVSLGWLLWDVCVWFEEAK